MRVDSARSLLTLCCLLGGCPSTANNTTASEAGVAPDARALLPTVDASTAPEHLDAGGAARDAGLDATLGDAAPDATNADDAASSQKRDAAAAARDAEASESDASSAPHACAVMAPTACPTPMPRYADVEPIFRQRCVVCHAPVGTGPWPLDDYQHVVDWQFDIRADLLNCSMPPPDAGMPLPQDESTQILAWIRCGLPN